MNTNKIIASIVVAATLASTTLPAHAGFWSSARDYFFGGSSRNDPYDHMNWEVTIINGRGRIDYRTMRANEARMQSLGRTRPDISSYYSANGNRHD